MSFEQFSLPPFITSSLKSLGFEKPTPIQEKALPPAIEGRDVVGMAQTGTGKTAAYSIPMVLRLNSLPQQTGLVLVPTRELAQQVTNFIRNLVGKNQSLRVTQLIGGVPMKQQTREINGGARIYVATPGRLIDHLRLNPKLLSRTSILILDEADRMLDMGFVPQVRIILRALPRERQTMMFSATFPKDVRDLANSHMRNPVEVSVGQPSEPVRKIEQAMLQVTQAQKNDVLLDELNAREGSVLIFTRTKHRTHKLNRYLMEYGYSVTFIHGNRTQAQRRKSIEGFRSGEFRILVATDIAARGLDIADIGHVINYDLPQVAEDYVHRIGRTARNGKGGKALCFVTPEDHQMWRSITKLTNAQGSALPELPPPPKQQQAARPQQKRPEHKHRPQQEAKSPEQKPRRPFNKKFRRDNTKKKSGWNSRPSW